LCTSKRVGMEAEAKGKVGVDCIWACATQGQAVNWVATLSAPEGGESAAEKLHTGRSAKRNNPFGRERHRDLLGPGPESSCPIREQSEGNRGG
jgi:hypothetical protein